MNLPKLADATLKHYLETHFQQQVIASVHILEGQFVVELPSTDNSQSTIKFVSPQVIRQAFSQLGCDSGFLQSSILRWGYNLQGEWVIKFIHPQVVTVWLTKRKKSNQVTFPIPGLVLFGQGTVYHLFATTSPTFEANAIVYQAPFPNTDAQGRICFGVNNAVPIATSQTIDAVWELFLTTPFSQDYATGKSKTHPNDIVKQLFAIKKQKEYPQEDLVPLQASSRFEMLIENLIN